MLLSCHQVGAAYYFERNWHARPYFEDFEDSPDQLSSRMSLLTVFSLPPAKRGPMIWTTSRTLFKCYPSLPRSSVCLRDLRRHSNAVARTPEACLWVFYATTGAGAMKIHAAFVKFPEDEAQLLIF